MKSQATKVLILEEDAVIRAALADRLHRKHVQVVIAGSVEAALDQLRREPAAAAFLGAVDAGGLLAVFRRLLAAQSGLVAILAAPSPGVGEVVDGMRAGAADFLAHPLDIDALAAHLAGFAGSAMPDDALPIAEDHASREVLDLARRVAATNATALLCGESGVGKEVVARFIHMQSQRATGPFVAINCAAIPENMLEAMLFGHERGAFTGAHEARPGKFEQAQGGTILLDEISEMAAGLQAKLLRVIQEREVERLGGRRTIPLDVRVVATTNRDLGREVDEGRFREDLFYRLSVFPLRIPPLRERPGDILPLACRSISRHARGGEVPELDRVAADRLLDHPWPGNVRELDNVIQRAMILSGGDIIRAEDLRFSLAGSTAPRIGPAPSHDEEVEDLRGDLTRREERLIVEALQTGSRKAAAERLGISPRTLRYKLARMREAGVAIP